MKTRSAAIWLTIAGAILAAAALARTDASLVIEIGEDITPLVVIVSAVFVCLFGFLLKEQLTFQIDEKGIAVNQWNHLRYFLPWEAVQSVGLEKCDRGTLVLYVSRYDAEKTKPLAARMLESGHMETLPFTINSAVSGRKMAEKAEEAPILILSESSSEAEYKRILQYWNCRLVRFPEGETLTSEELC